MEGSQGGPPIPQEGRVGFGNEQGGKVELDIPQEGSLLEEASRLQQEMARLKKKANQKLNSIFDSTRAWVSDQERLKFTMGEGDKSQDVDWYGSNAVRYYYIADEGGQPVHFRVIVHRAKGDEAEATIQEFSGLEQPVGEPNEADEKNMLRIYQQELGRGYDRYVEVYQPIGEESTYGKYAIAGFGTKRRAEHSYKAQGPTYDNEWYSSDADRPIDALQYAERTLDLLRGARLYGVKSTGFGDKSFEKVTSVVPQAPSIKI